MEIDSDGDIFAVGDVHGDNNRLVTLLAAARIVERRANNPETVTWIAGKAILVFTGDLIDKGPHSLDVLRFVRSLQDASLKAGGRVVVLMGNHEAEFLADPTATKVRDFAQALRDSGIAAKDVAACRGELGRYMCSLPLGARVRDWFFSHGGNTAGRSIKRLRSDLEEGVDKDGFGTRQLVGENSLLEARLGEEGPGGRSWFDFENPSRNAEQILADYTAALGVAHLVQGHQHQRVIFPDGIRDAGQMFQWHGLLFLIDVGMSEGVGDSHGAVLRIQARNGQEAVVICPNGSEASIWDDKRRPETGGAPACGSPK